MEKLAHVPEVAIYELFRELRRIPLLDPSHDDVRVCRERLSELYVQGGYGQPQQHATYVDERTETISPVCVSQDVYNPTQPQK
jgi:hypothetical protein